MKRTRTYFVSVIFILSIILSGCSLTTDLEEMHSTPLPNLENTGGDDGGTGGNNPPPPAD